MLEDQLFIRYARLWNKYRTSRMSFLDIQTLLKISETNAKVIIHRLMKEKVLFVDRKKKDARRKAYHLLSPILFVKRKLAEIQ